MYRYCEMATLADPYGVLHAAGGEHPELPVCEKCECKLDKMKMTCPRCRMEEKVPELQVKYLRCTKCARGMVWNGTFYQYVCLQCGICKEGPCPHSQESRRMMAILHDPIKHFQSWIIHIFGWESVTELGDVSNLLIKMKNCMERAKLRR